MSAFNPNLLIPPMAQESRPLDFVDSGEYWDFLEVVVSEPNGSGRRRTYVYDSREDTFTRVFSDGRTADEPEDDTPEGVERPDGPMMNFIWPLDSGQYLADPVAIAAAIGLRNVALVYVNDPSDFNPELPPQDAYWGIALTGGGMDLSWDIASAFVEAGYFPPDELTINQGTPEATWRYGVDQIGATAARKVKRALTVRLKNRALALKYNLKAVGAWK